MNLWTWHLSSNNPHLGQLDHLQIPRSSFAHVKYSHVSIAFLFSILIFPCLVREVLHFPFAPLYFSRYKTHTATPHSFLRNLSFFSSSSFVADYLAFSRRFYTSPITPYLFPAGSKSLRSIEIYIFTNRSPHSVASTRTWITFSVFYVIYVCLCFKSIIFLFQITYFATVTGFSFLITRFYFSHLISWIWFGGQLANLCWYFRKHKKLRVSFYYWMWGCGARSLCSVWLDVSVLCFSFFWQFNRFLLTFLRIFLFSFVFYFINPNFQFRCYLERCLFVEIIDMKCLLQRLWWMNSVFLLIMVILLF